MTWKGSRWYQYKVSKPPMKLNIALRKCLMCGQQFTSTHIGNRVCKACRETEDWRGYTV